MTSACYVCKNTAKETRPYGINGQPICFDCMKADAQREAEAERQLATMLNGGDVVIDDEGPRRPTLHEAVLLEDLLDRASKGPDA